MKDRPKGRQTKNREKDRNKKARKNALCQKQRFDYTDNNKHKTCFP